MREPPERATEKDPLSLIEESEIWEMKSARQVESSSTLSNILTSPRFFSMPVLAIARATIRSLLAAGFVRAKNRRCKGGRARRCEVGDLGMERGGELEAGNCFWGFCAEEEEEARRQWW